MKSVRVLGTGMTKFGELWSESVESLALTAAAEALEEARCKVQEIDALIVGNMLLSQLEQRAHVGRLIGDTLHYAGPAVAVEGACASGGLAVRQGLALVRSGMARRVLVVGVEKMTDWDVEAIGRLLMGAGSEAEQWAGATFPALYALITRAYLDHYQLSEEVVDAFAVKAHGHAAKNPLAQFQLPITEVAVRESALVAEPIRQLNCSPISDGAAVVVLGLKGGAVEVVGSGHGGDSLALGARESLYSLRATKMAAREAFIEARVAVGDIDVAEVHDCFSIAEALALEDLGFVPPGAAPHWIAGGNGSLGQTGLVVNPSGGLKACGHPVGATGVKQIVELTRQLQGRAHGRQVTTPRLALAHNVGGSGATAVVHILRRINGN